jgi:hypothetical protein
VELKLSRVQPPPPGEHVKRIRGRVIQVERITWPPGCNPPAKWAFINYRLLHFKDGSEKLITPWCRIVKGGPMHTAEQQRVDEGKP